MIHLILAALAGVGFASIPIHDEWKAWLLGKVYNETALWLIMKFLDCHVCKTFWTTGLFCLALGDMRVWLPSWGLACILYTITYRE